MLKKTKTKQWAEDQAHSFNKKLKATTAMSQLKTNWEMFQDYSPQLISHHKTALTTDLVTELKQALREIVDVIFNTAEVGVEEIRHHQYSVPSPILHLVLLPPPLCTERSDHQPKQNRRRGAKSTLGRKFVSFAPVQGPLLGPTSSPGPPFHTMKFI